MINDYLGHAQRKILELLWENKDGLMPREVHDKMYGERSISTVHTLLNRMVMKGLVAKNEDGRFQAKKSREVFVQEILLAVQDHYPHEFARIIQAYPAKLRVAS